MPTELGTDGVLVGPSSDIPEGGRLVVDVGGVEVGIFRVDDRLYAYRNVCAHAGGPVCQGKILPRVEETLDEQRRSNGHRWVEDEPRIACPWHGYEYDLKTGLNPAKRGLRLRSYPVVESGGNVYLLPKRTARS